MSLSLDEEMNNESERAFCFFFIGFHDQKYSCLMCNYFSRCRKDADKMIRANGKLLWIFDWNNPKRPKPLIQSRNEKEVKKVEKKDSKTEENEETEFEKEMKKFQKCPVCG